MSVTNLRDAAQPTVASSPPVLSELGIPTEESRTDGRRVSCRGIIVNLSDQVRQIRESGATSGVILADQLVVDSLVDVSGLSLSIVARKIIAINAAIYARSEAGGGAVRIVYRSATSAAEIVIVDTTRQRRKFPLNEAVSDDVATANTSVKSIEVSWSAGQSTTAVRHELRAGMPEGANEDRLFSRYLTTECAYVMSVDSATGMDSVDILDWIIDCASSNPALVVLAGECRILKTHLETSSEGRLYVPALHPSQYLGVADAYLEAAREYSTACARIQASSDLNVIQGENVKLWMRKQQSVVATRAAAIDQARSELRNKKNAVALASHRLWNYNTELQYAGADFVAAVERIERDQVLSGVMDTALGAFQIALSLPTIAGAAGAGALPALETAKSLGKAAVGVAKSAPDAFRKAMGKAKEWDPDQVHLDDIFEGKFDDPEPKSPAAPASATDMLASQKASAAVSSAIAGGSKMVEGIQGIMQAVQRANAAESAALSAVANAGAQIDNHGGTEVATTGIDSVTGGSDPWEIFRIEFHAAWADVIALDGYASTARQFQTKVDTLITFGKTLCQCRHAVAQAGLRYATLVAQGNVENEFLKSLDVDIEAIEDEEEKILVLKEQAYWFLAGVKRSLLVSLMNYKQSFLFWGLLEVNIPSMRDDVPTIVSSFAELKRKRIGAMSRWGQAPQQFGNGLSVTDEKALQSMVQTGSVAFTISADNKAFGNFDRVRISDVDIKLEGVTLPDTVNIIVTTSGSYDDRLHGDNWQFVTRPWKRLLVFKNGAAITDGRTTSEFKSQFLEPTPFTEWTIDVTDQNDERVDLAGLSAIKLELSGSFVLDS